jgi:antitoxin Phd
LIDYLIPAQGKKLRDFGGPSTCVLTIIAIKVKIAIMKEAMSPAPIARGDRPQAAAVTATEAKNEFGRVLETVIRGQVMFITKHGAAKAVLMPVDEYNALSRATETQLNELTDEFDALAARMQTPKARAGMKAAFHASPKQLGKAAVAAGRLRR